MLNEGENLLKMKFELAGQVLNNKMMIWMNSILYFTRNKQATAIDKLFANQITLWRPHPYKRRMNEVESIGSGNKFLIWVFIVLIESSTIHGQKLTINGFFEFQLIDFCQILFELKTIGRNEIKQLLEWWTRMGEKKHVKLRFSASDAEIDSRWKIIAI